MLKNNSAIPLFLILMVCNLANPALAERQSLTSIELQAESFIANYSYQTPYPVEYSLSQLDQRLNLKPCNQGLDIAFTRADRVMGNTSLSIRCASPVNWQIHLPAKIQVYADVITTKAPLIKGQAIHRDLVKFQKQDISRLHQGYYQQLDDLKQMQAKRNLPANTILNSAHLSQKMLVKSGQQVDIVLNFNGVQIKSTGRALHSAGRGQVVKVKNIRSNKIVEGIVTGEAQISVSL